MSYTVHNHFGQFVAYYTFGSGKYQIRLDDGSNTLEPYRFTNQNIALAVAVIVDGWLEIEEEKE